ncbi:MAG: hypothetical protein HPM95_00410 [Alphaproteobacteria bacterium]|nr:hypothetical protein [Alphaproteobacteria bacterium]
MRAELEAAPSPEEGMARLDGDQPPDLAGARRRLRHCQCLVALSAGARALCEATHDAVDAVAFRAIRHCGAARTARRLASGAHFGWPSYFTRRTTSASRSASAPRSPNMP